MVEIIQVYILTFNCGVGVSKGTIIIVEKIDLSVFKKVTSS